jgi:spore coat protein CotH
MGTMRILLTTAVLSCLSCSSEPVETGTAPIIKDSPVQQQETGLGWGIEQVESNPDVINGNYIFDPARIHHFAIEMDADAQNSLTSDPRNYATVSIISEGQRMNVGMRLKGNSTFQDFSGKPSFKISFDNVVDDQVFYGLENVNFHANVLDASMLHEHMAFYIYREAGLPAARTGWATVEINSTDFGIYTLSEVQDDVFLEQWWEDTSGSVYESGSFEGSCDLSDGGCDCFEHDLVGDGDTTKDLQSLCSAATTSDDWHGGIKDLVDWEPWLHTMAMDMILAHWDNYGFNVNNYRLYHEPSKGLWYWTSWSTDLAFGWNPWGGCYCGEYGTWPADHSRGYLLSRCWSSSECKTELLDAMSEMADRFESMDLVTEIQRVYDLISEEKYQDPRHPWNTDQFESEFSCMESWVQTRPDSIRSFIDSQR